MQPYDDFAARAGRFGTLAQPARLSIKSATNNRRCLELFCLNEESTHGSARLAGNPCRVISRLSASGPEAKQK
jgi:hypothetical protein